MSFSGVYNLADPEDGRANVGNKSSNYPKRTDMLYSSGDSIAICSDLGKDINWVELPSPVVVNIYSFLSKTDQYSMSQVCPRWSREFDAPCLWKKMIFYLPEHDFSSEICPEVRFAQKYGHIFKHVEIICKEVEIHLIGVIRKELTHFLKILAKASQLTSIKFIDMEEYFNELSEWEEFEACEDLFNVIISFLRSQRNLKKVIFRKSHFLNNMDMELMKAILHPDCNTITSLKLVRFRNCFETPDWSHEYMSDLKEVCRKIVSVRSLAMDYTPFFEEVINEVYEMLLSDDYQIDKNKPLLSKIKIHCMDIAEEAFGDAEVDGIDPEIWEYLKSLLPDLKIKMDLTICCNLAEMEKFLVREMPLSSLEFRFDDTSAMTDISDLITQLQTCQYQNHLQILNVLWFPPISDFAQSIIPFVQSCNKLKVLQLHTESMPNDIESILKELLEYHPMSLESINLRFNNYPESDDDKKIEAMSEAYNLLFRSQGIEFFLVVQQN